MVSGSGKDIKQQKTKRPINKKKILKMIIAIAFIGLIIATIFLYTKNETVQAFLDKYIFNKEEYELKLPKIEIDSSNNLNIYAYNNRIVILEQNLLKVYNKYANQEYTIDVAITNPVFESNGEFLCIAEKSGNKIYLISDRQIIWQKDIEGNISNVSVNQNGYVSIAVSGTSYKTVVITFDQKGNELFKTYLSTTNIIDTDISNDNKYLAIAESNFAGIVIQSTVKIISIEDARKNAEAAIIYTHTATQNDMITNIEYKVGNKLICMYDGHIDFIKDNENTEMTNFTNEEILFADINLDKNVLKIIKKSTGMFSAEAEMQIINLINQNKNVYDIKEVPKKINVYENMIAINLGTEALFINNNGWLVKRYHTSQEIQNIVICNEIAGIIYKNKIEIISL